MKSSLIFEIISEENINVATEIQNTIFPKENGFLNFKCSIDEEFYKDLYNGNVREKMIFWICKNQKEESVGITGIYSYFEYPDDAWLGWYGVLPEHQKKGYGKQILLQTMEKAKEMGFKNFRLYTDLVDNKVAVGLYRKLGMIEEPYLAEDMGEGNETYIFSKSLDSSPSEKLGNRMLFLKEQEEIQLKSQGLLNSK